MKLAALIPMRHHSQRVPLIALADCSSRRPRRRDAAWSFNMTHLAALVPMPGIGKKVHDG